MQAALFSLGVIVVTTAALDKFDGDDVQSALKRPPSFVADLNRGIWGCFGNCSEGGDVLRFAALMQGLDPDKGENIRTAALALAEGLRIDTDSPGIRTNGKRQKHIQKATDSEE